MACERVFALLHELARATRRCNVVLSQCSPSRGRAFPGV